MQTYLTYVLPKAPDLTLIWFRSPDSPQHQYGPGLAELQGGAAEPGLPARPAAGRAQGQGLGPEHRHHHRLRSRPLVGVRSARRPSRCAPSRRARAAPRRLGAVDANGYSVSGDVRLADILVQAGLRQRRLRRQRLPDRAGDERRQDRRHSGLRTRRSTPPAPAAAAPPARPTPPATSSSRPGRRWPPATS